jgi:hypothetical protein
LGKKVNNIWKNTETVLGIREKVDLEVNAEGTKYMFTSSSKCRKNSKYKKMALNS